MENILLFFVLGLFVAMVFLNLYFRLKVLKSYKILVKNRIEFNAMDVFKPKKLEEEVYPKYPEFKKDIQTFSSHIRYSVKMATVLISLITIFGAILMYYR